MKTLNSKSILYIAILLVGLLLAYYFIFFLPSSKNKGYNFERMVKCSEDGQKMYSQIITEIEEEPGSPLYGKKYEVHFNEELNRCLLGYEYNYGEVTARYVKDVYSNEGLISYFRNGEFEGETTLKDYDKKYKELFNK